MKKIFGSILIGLFLLVVTACGPSEKKPYVGIALPITSDEFFVGIGNTLKEAFEAEGYRTQITDSNSDTNLYRTQIENFVTNNVDALYIFASGEPDAYYDVLKEAKSKGIKVIASHNPAPLADATVNIMADEFLMGVMTAPMVTKWLDREYPNAADKSVKTLALEQSLIPEMVKRSAGMKIIGQKFLRRINLSTGKYITTAGNDVSYKNTLGQIVKVEEPTGGLILDDNGYAILNPFYDARVNMIEISKRDHQTNLDSQNSIDTFITNPENSDLKIVLNYGGDGAAGSSEKLLDLKREGKITTDLNKLAVFGADITDTNIQRIKDSATNKTLVRGVMTNGNMIATLKKYATAIAKGEDVPHESWEDLGYMMLNDSGTDVISITYNNQLPSTDKFLD